MSEQTPAHNGRAQEGIPDPLFIERQKRFFVLELVTEVRTDGLYVRLHPFQREPRHIPFANISTFEATRYSALNHSGWHWGMRVTPDGIVYRLSPVQAEDSLGQWATPLEVSLVSLFWAAALCFLLAAAALLRWRVPSEWFTRLVVVGVVFSIVLQVIWLSGWAVLPLLVNVALLWAVFGRHITVRSLRG